MNLVDWQTLGRDLLGLSDSANLLWYLDKILRPVVIYLMLVFVLKRYGKRILAQLNPFDLVVLLTLSNTVQNAIIGSDNSLWGGIIGACSLLAVNMVLVRIFYRGPTVDQRDGDVHLIRNYQLQEDQMRRLHINIGELTARAHERGFDALEEVESAVLYPNGTMYLKGASQDSARITQILEQVTALRQEVAQLRR